jgi:hypothetical protein
LRGTVDVWLTRGGAPQNLSASKHQVHGAAYGSGVYTADQLSQSLAYAVSSDQRLAGAAQTRTLTLVAACKLLPNPALVRIEPHVRYNIVQDVAALWMTHVPVYGTGEDELLK